MMNISEKWIKCLPILLLPLGCSGLSSVFQAVGIIVFLYLYFKRREEFDFKIFFQNKLVKYSLICFIVWIMGMMLSDFVSRGNIKESWNWCQRILPFFLAGLFTIKNNKYFKAVWIGLTLSLLIVSCNVLYSLFIQEHWRPITMFNSPNKLGGFLILLIPFVFGGIYTFKNNFRLKVYGMIVLTLGIVSLIISGCNVLYSLFIQEHWRPITMFNSPNKLGGFLILLIPFVFGGIYTFKNNFRLKVYGMIVLTLGIVSLIISGCRGAMLGLLLGSFICFIMIEYKKLPTRKFALNIFKAACIIIIGLIIVYFVFPVMISRSYDMERVYLWNSAIKMFCDYPVFGVGVGNFNEYYINNGYINPLAKEANLDTPHNMFLWFLAERGIIVGLPFVIMLMFQAYMLLRNVLTDYKKINIWCCCGAVVVVGMIVHSMVDTVPNNRTYQLMYWLLYGVSCYSIIYNKKINNTI